MHPHQLRGLAKAFVLVQLCASALAIVAVVLQATVRDDAKAYRGGSLGIDQFKDRLDPYFAAVISTGLVSGAALVLLIIWSYRAAANLGWLERRPQRWRKGWGIGVWLLQGLTLSILPFLMLRELWRGSDPGVPRGDPRWKERPFPPLLAWWLAINIAQAITAAAGAGFIGISSGVSFNNQTDDVAKAIAERFPAIVIAAVLSLVSTVLLIVIVRQITTRQAHAIGN
jgi:hypothetical protein